jgi:1-acyl-sn-glycerol-3-phosphate acyltransferase
VPRRHTDKAPPRLEDRPLIRALHGLNVLFVKGYHRLHVLTPCTIPPSGGGILVCNHTSGLDPMMIQATTPRVITWMMAKEFYDMPALNWAFRMLNAIPVSRSGRDTGPTRAAIRTLHDGGLLGVFPEGRIERERKLMPFQTGVALMAIKTGVPVYPAYLDGTQRSYRSMLQAFINANNATLTYGEPVAMDRSATDKDALIAATAQIQAAVQALMDRTPAPAFARRGVSASDAVKE